MGPSNRWSGRANSGWIFYSRISWKAWNRVWCDYELIIFADNGRAEWVFFQILTNATMAPLSNSRSKFITLVKFWNLCIVSKHVPFIPRFIWVPQIYTFTYFQYHSLELLARRSTVRITCTSLQAWCPGVKNKNAPDLKEIVSYIICLVTLFQKRNSWDNIRCFIAIATRQTTLNSINVNGLNRYLTLLLCYHDNNASDELKTIFSLKQCYKTSNVIFWGVFFILFYKFVLLLLLFCFCLFVFVHTL